MIISHRHRYLFIQLPRTGCTSIAKELITYYDGKKIHRKHSTYRKFLRHATDEEKSFYVFSGIRNPIDRTVSEYVKFKNNHGNAYTDPQKIAEMTNPIRRMLTMRRFNFIRKHNADFETYFRKFYRIPYEDWSCLDHKKFDYIIRFEDIQNGFAEALKQLNIPQVRPLPVVNKTGGKEKRDYSAYFSKEAIPHARKVFGPFMQSWDYPFPDGWGPWTPSLVERIELNSANLARKLFWITQ